MLQDLGIYDDLVGNADYAENWWYTFGLGYLARQAKPLWEKHTRRQTTRQVLEIAERYGNVWAVEFAELGALMDHPQVRAIDLVHASLTGTVTCARRGACPGHCRRCAALKRTWINRLPG